MGIEEHPVAVLNSCLTLRQFGKQPYRIFLMYGHAAGPP